MSLTLEKIFEAKNRIAPYTTRTPLIRLEKLDEYLGCQVYLKAECMRSPAHLSSAEQSTRSGC